MATAATSLPILGGSRSHCSKNQPFFLQHPTNGRTNLILPRPSFHSFSLVAFARRRQNAPNSTSVTPKKLKKKKNSMSKDAQEDEELDEDAFEALFRQLEEDLKNDGASLDDFDDDDISEEDLAKLEKELEEALKDDELLGALGSIEDEKTENEAEDEEEEGEEDENFRTAYEDHNLEEEDDEDNEDDEIPLQLKNWQLKRLAYALKAGRRKTSIKNLAADLCLDRALVLNLLRDPPPNLLMLSAAVPDKPVSTVVEPVKEPAEAISSEAIPAIEKSEAKANMKVPVHVMQRNWSAQKRIKKVQLETLERVYKRTKRPTNAMISSIVHVTNLPRRRVLKWFEDQRAEDGVPERRLPYQRPLLQDP